MIAFRVSWTLVLVSGVSLGFAAQAEAHIRLTEPIARYEIMGFDDGIKGCPCGIALATGQKNRCNVAEDGSDPNRDAERASTFAAGSTVKLKFEEYVGHPGRYRVAFDPDGADFEDFNANVLHDEADPAGADGNIGDGSNWEIEVTLPNTPCDNCTLQLTQVMEGSVDEPVDGDNLENLSTYYTCIDITLTGGDGDTSDAASSDTGSDSTMSGAESSEVTSAETSQASESSSRAGITSGATSLGHDEQTSETEAASTRPAPTSTATTTTNATTATTQAQTTTTVSATSAENTTSPDATTDDDSDDSSESGCSVAFSPKPTVTLFSTFVAVALGVFLRRRRA